MKKLLEESDEGSFHLDLKLLINKYSIDAKIGVPDFVLTNHIRNQLVGLHELQGSIRAYNGDGTFDIDKL